MLSAEYQSPVNFCALDIVVNDKLMKIEGEGGMVGVDAKGNGVMIFNCEGMYRGMASSDGKKEIAIYKE